LLRTKPPFVASFVDLEEQVGLLAAQRQIADLVNDQQTVGIDRAIVAVADAPCASPLHARSFRTSPENAST